jgi:hypothetical protein
VPAGGVFLLPHESALHVLKVAHSAKRVNELKEYDDARLLTFNDGTPILNHSVVCGKGCILSAAFANGASPYFRFYNIVGGETQVFGNAKVYLSTADEVAQINELLAGTRMVATGDHIPVELLLESGFTKLFQEGLSLDNGLKITFRRQGGMLYVADNKSANNIAGVSPNVCYACGLDHDALEHLVMGGESRSLEDINNSFNDILSMVAVIIAFLVWGEPARAQHWAKELTGSNRKVCLV